jgi:2,3-bisphosphoglycerate-independent phosphoglycerate mutase
MDNLDLIRQLSITSPAKIVMLIMDGLGGLPHPETGKTELETARTPNMDSLAAKGICGLSEPVGPGITSGSTPGHLALFGYDPVKYDMGRGVVEVMGIDFKIEPKDIAARGNFGTVDENGLVTDRRAGRISTEKCTELCHLLEKIEIEGVRLFVLPVREHRFAVIFRGEGLAPELSDSDPQQLGVAPKTVKAQKETAQLTAKIANEFIAKAKKILAAHHPANMVLLRGFSRRPDIPTMNEIYKLKPAAIASYPMYRGLARLVGMELLETRADIKEEFAVLKENYADYDFFFLHVKGTDSAGEDGDFARKARVIEEVDKAMPTLINLKPDVIVVTGDHSTPAMLKAHSWHPLPVLLYSKYCRADRVGSFSETACITGGLGRLPATQLMPLAMANALKLTKFGA